ncbi:hypothetical protein BPNSA17_24910 [Bordetella petrii]
MRAQDAAAWHAKVMAGDAIGDALSQKGDSGRHPGPGTATTQRSVAIHGLLRRLAPVQVAGEMAITAGGRRYRLPPESEQWCASSEPAPPRVLMTSIFMIRATPGQVPGRPPLMALKELGG